MCYELSNHDDNESLFFAIIMKHKQTIFVKLKRRSTTDLFIDLFLQYFVNSPSSVVFFTTWFRSSACIIHATTNLVF